MIESMKVLILLKSFNYPPCNGGDQAVFNAIARMEKYVQYYLITTEGTTLGRISVEAFHHDFPQIPVQIYDLGKNDSYQQLMNQCQRIANFCNNRNGNRQIVRMRMLKGYDAQLDYFDCFYRFLNNYIRDNRIDIIQSEFSFTLGWLKGITGDVKKVFVQHEIQFVVNHQRLLQRVHTMDDIYFYEQERQQEINAMNCCDAVITLSEDDRQKLLFNGVHAPVYASFAQIRLHNIEIKYPVQIKKQLVFVGPETHEPNFQGLLWFMEKVLPLIQSQEQELTVAIIGRWSLATINSWQRRYNGICFLGFVDDLPTAIAESILIVPLFQGSGIRMKILEACNIGIPFVSTTIGAEGLGFTDGVDGFIADTADNFADKVLRLLQDNVLANQFIRESVQRIRTNFSDKRFVESRMRCYEGVMKGIVR